METSCKGCCISEVVKWYFLQEILPFSQEPDWDRIGTQRGVRYWPGKDKDIK